MPDVDELAKRLDELEQNQPVLTRLGSPTPMPLAPPRLPDPDSWLGQKMASDERKRHEAREAALAEERRLAEELAAEAAARGESERERRRRYDAAAPARAQALEDLAHLEPQLAALEAEIAARRVVVKRWRE